MSEVLYKIVITGYYHVDITGYKTHKGEYYIEKDFAKLFHITRLQAREIIQSSPKVIKENITIEEANHYREKIEEAGVSCEIQDMDSKPSELTLEPE
jgi:hypothetical protein